MVNLNFLIHKVARKFKINSTLFIFLRKISSIILVPILFSYTHSHIQTVLKNRSQFKNNKHYPWLTYPAIEFIKSKNLYQKKVLEFGSGSSTIFFLEKGCYIKTFESDINWFKSIPQNDRIHKIHLLVQNYKDLEEELNNSKIFDIVLIDGHERIIILEYIIENNLLAKDGVIIFDNSEGYELSFNLKKNLFNSFQKVDFYGFSPGGAIDKHCTTFLFKEKSFIFDVKDDINNKKDINSPL